LARTDLRPSRPARKPRRVGWLPVFMTVGQFGGPGGPNTIWYIQTKKP
jgi:hypothetical protein